MLADQGLFLVLVALYVHECTIRQSAGEPLFFGTPGGCRPALGPIWGLASGSGFSLIHLFPPLGTAFRSQGSSFDWKSAESRRDDWRRETIALRALCCLLFIVVFGGVMLMSAMGGWSAWWPIFAAGCVGAWVIVLLEGLLVMSRLHGLSIRQSLARCGTLLISPMSAMRACDVASASLFSGFHPAVTAYVLCRPDEFHRVCRTYLYAGASEGLPGAAAVRTFLEQVGAIDAIETPPDREAGAVSYCPRCSSQFSAPAPTCADCGGVALRQFM
jgi:hypothetical protein